MGYRADICLSDTHDIDAHAESLVVESLCLPHHISSTLSLLEQLFSDTQYTSPDNLHQIKSLLVSASASANASIASSGHALAGYRAQLGMTSHAVLSERARGLTSMDALQRWVDAVEADPAALEALASIFRHLAGICFRRDRMQLSVVTEPSLINQVDTHLANMTWQLSSDAHFKLDDVVAALGLPTGPDAAVVPDKAFFGYPIAVNFNVLSFASVPLLHADHAPLSVLGQVLSSCHLHQHVRERGGAYGCSAAQGVFTMSSYFDPHTTQTFEAYEDAVRYAVDGKFTDADVNQALLATFSGIDAPQAPSAKVFFGIAAVCRRHAMVVSHQGKGLFTRGFTYDMLQVRRSQLLQVTRADLMRVAATHLANETVVRRAVVVGKEEGRDDLERRGFQ
ncbi:hypothetical protein DYB32_006640 [Aphanomyces invadans]|uniref:Peptidase M16C associated domain-containing protein n=1 Tax=Aphanomyces invadans TaxID=157072 RepID=A0A418AR78_9STRA|nr:hypothetical protein DYB32_006640 [Aphanomyces invadans]